MWPPSYSKSTIFLVFCFRPLECSPQRKGEQEWNFPRNCASSNSIMYPFARLLNLPASWSDSPMSTLTMAYFMIGNYLLAPNSRTLDILLGRFLSARNSNMVLYWTAYQTLSKTIKSFLTPEPLEGGTATDQNKGTSHFPTIHGIFDFWIARLTQGTYICKILVLVRVFLKNDFFRIPVPPSRGPRGQKNSWSFSKEFDMLFSRRPCLNSESIKIFPTRCLVF